MTKRICVASMVMMLTGNAMVQAKYLIGRTGSSPVAGVYYLDPLDGSDSDDGMTEGNAWATIAKVTSSSSEGDTIHISNMDDTITGVDWPDRTYKASEINQWGITWTFSAEKTIGQFCNWDMWVLGPVTIDTIAPATVVDANGYQRHGSMVDIMPRGDNVASLPEPQGFDEQILPYADACNVALSLPYVLAVNKSLVSTESQTVNMSAVPGHHSSRSCVDKASVLTCLSSAPTYRSFRPPYCGTDKTVKYDVTDISYAVFHNYTWPSGYGSGDFVWIRDRFPKVCLDFYAQYPGAYLHPAENMLNYAAEWAREVAWGVLVLNLNYTNTEKELLLIRLLQIGIDQYGVLSSPGGGLVFRETGGHVVGRKMPLMLAARVFDDADMKTLLGKTGVYLYTGDYDTENPPPDYISMDDDQFFYVTQKDIDITNGVTWNPSGGPAYDAVKTPYAEGDVGLPEWASAHLMHPEQANKWLGCDYRPTTCQSQPSIALATLMIGGKTLWNNDAYFDYADRWYWEVSPAGSVPGYELWTIYTELLWDAHRTEFGTVWTYPE